MILQARPTTYNGIQMRSRLEASWAAELDRLDWGWDYEPRAFASPRGQYLPDFMLSDDGGRHGFLEVKGHLELEEVGSVLARMEIIHASEPDAFLWLMVGDPERPAIFTKDGENGVWEFMSVDLHPVPKPGGKKR